MDDSPEPVEAPVFPAGDAIDCHAHVIGPQDRYPYAGDRMYTPSGASVEAYRSVMRRLGVNGYVIVQPSFYGNDNRCSVDAARELGAANVIAAVAPDAAPGHLRSLWASGVRGLRINRAQPGMDLSKQGADLAPYIGMAKEFGFHLQLLQWPRMWPSVLPALNRAGVAWVVDHLGMIPAGEGVDSEPFRAICDALASGLGWIKLSAFYRVSQHSGHADARPMVEKLYDVAAQRCIWGSDWPHTHAQPGTQPDTDTAGLLKTLLEWLPDDRARRQVLVDNPIHLFGAGELGRRA